MQADWEIGPGTLTSITAYRDWKKTGGFDADFSTADIFYLPNDTNSTRFRTFSQELRYGGTAGKRPRMENRRRRNPARARDPVRLHDHG